MLLIFQTSYKYINTFYAYILQMSESPDGTKEYCLGHITKTRLMDGYTPVCPNCKADIFKRQCPAYYPISLHKIIIGEVEEEFEYKVA